MRGPDKPPRKSFYPSRNKALYGNKKPGLKRGLKPGQILAHSYPPKLTAAQVAWIKGVIRLDRRALLCTAGRRARRPRVTRGLFDRLAARFNVTRWCIEAIDKRRTWKRVRARRFTER